MRKIISFLSIIFAVVSLSIICSCKYDQYLPPEEPVIVDSVFFTADILPIFNQACNGSGCHNAGAVPPDLSPGNAYNALINGDYIDTIDPENSELYQWMIGNEDRPMPLEGPDPQYNALVLAWIKQGALNN